MIFDTERELQHQLTHLDLEFEGSFATTFVRREVPIGNCIPDLIYVRFEEDPNPALWPRRWTFRHAHILWLLREKHKLTLESIASLTYESQAKVMPVLDDLVKSGAITRSRNGLLKLSIEMASLTAEVIAVEAKLELWKQALAQAVEYRRFANRVFVAMDSEKAPREPKILDQFKETEIGLCAVKKRSLEWIVYPPNHKYTIGPDREYLITSAARPASQQLWYRRNKRKAFLQA